ncbi:MAG: M23 family metallopeptidase [Nitrospirae bacterium]|nr:M23 family metallopeptidase [Nitrospirota bacterium]MBI3352360.1 M23 family metallopeptidase [Nitrospirota bacterium]
MEKHEESYTIMVLPNPTSKTYRFCVTKKTLKKIAGISSCGVLLLIFFLFQYFYLIGETWELNSLQKETVAQKLQLQMFSNRIEDLKKQMVRLKELDAKLRVIADIGPSKVNTEFFGMGGAEAASPIENLIENKNNPSGMIKKMEQDVSLLQSASIQQQVSFQELSEVMKEHQTMWTSTPSVWPVKGWMTSGFGNRVSPFTGMVSLHKGIDIAAKPETPITAPAAGIVRYDGFDSGFGREVRIEHGYGMETVYGHLAKSAVKVGQRIKRGDIIGYVGNTGLSTGPHLHYEIHVNSVPVNPLKYIIN